MKPSVRSFRHAREEIARTSPLARLPELHTVAWRAGLVRHIWALAARWSSPPEGEAAAMSVNDELRGLLQASKMADPNARAELLRSILGKLVDNHLRRPAAPNVVDEVDRVLMIVRHLATKQIGAYGWGEPEAIGPTVLCLVEQLPHPSEERQKTVLAALDEVLQLLPMGSAQALACLGREANELLRELAKPPTSVLDRGRERHVVAFEQFALLCSDPEPMEASDEDPAAVTLLAPATLRDVVDDPTRRAWARCGLLRMSAQLHASCPQFLGDGGADLWESALDHLSLDAIELHPRSGLSSSSDATPPLLLAAVTATGTLLSRFEAPPTMRSGLLYRILSLLSAGLPPSPSAAAAAAAAAASSAAAETVRDARPSTLPRFRSTALDDAIGSCLHALVNPSIPPLDCLPLLAIAVPHALASSASFTLHAACAAARDFGRRAAAHSACPLEPFRSAGLPSLVPCFERARAVTPVSETTACAEDGETDAVDGAGSRGGQLARRTRARSYRPDGGRLASSRGAAIAAPAAIRHGDGPELEAQSSRRPGFLRGARVSGAAGHHHPALSWVACTPMATSGGWRRVLRSGRR